MMSGLPTQDPQPAKAMKNPFCDATNLDVIGCRTQAKNIFCCEKSDCVKNSRPKLFRSNRQALFCGEAVLKISGNLQGKSSM